MKARKASTLVRHAKEGEIHKTFHALVLAARDELRQMEREGVVPEGTAEKYHPVRTLIRIEHDPDTPQVIRLAAAKEILQYVEAPKSAVMRLDAIDAAGGPPQISIVIAPWAANKPSAPFLPEPTETAIVEPGTPQTNGTPPAPMLSDRDRLREQVRAQRETVIIEAPARPDQPQREVARVSQARGVVKPLTLEQKLANKGVGRQREVAPETSVSSNFPLFGR